MADQLGVLLRRLRRQAGLTQEQAAERSGVSVRTIRRLETGASADHRMGTVSLLADALGIGPEDRRELAAILAKAQSASAFPPPPGADADPEPGELAAKAPERVDEAHAALSFPFPLPAPPPPVHDVLAVAAQELAREVRRIWRHEEEQRQVHDPFPLPVRWQQAPAHLVDRWENVQRLGPGAVSHPVDLSGDVRSVAEVFRRIPSGRLVILGQAGSGKSILAIRFLLDHFEHPAADGRVPVIFSLSAWDPSATVLHDWLTERLLRDHPYLSRTGPSGSTLAAALVDAGLILPVLDGFDEIAQGLRTEALEALNASSLPLILTSRRDEFSEAVRAVHAPLVWAAGIELNALTPDDVAAYLPRATRTVTPGKGSSDNDAGKTPSAWDAVLEALRTQESLASTNLAEVLTTPLMVALARTIYSQTPGWDPAELLDSTRFPTKMALEQHLLSGFVPALYRRRASRQSIPSRQRRQRNWDPERAEQWLGYLAHHLTRLGRDRQVLAWWEIGDCLRRRARITAVVLATALCVTTTDWLISPLFPLPDLGSTLLMAALAGPVAGVAFGSIYAVLMSFRNWAAIEPARAVLRLLASHQREGRRLLPVFTSRFGHGLLGGFLLGIGYACALALARNLYWGTPLTNPHVIESTLINMLLFGLLFGSAAGLAFGLAAALEVPMDISASASPASLLSSNRAAVGRQILLLAPLLTLTITLGGHLAAELLDGLFGPLQWGIWDGILIGAVAGIGGGASYALAFTAWGQWILLTCIWLPLTGKLPWNTLSFLDDAYRRGVLRQTGAVYQFRHIRLQHHLADAYRHRSA
ncbi:helix-turn-helix domain-containing protein [Streptomyces sp. NPDC059168]|uniref:helix-turn-helix domain-containing protein n=1 Tax=Streptomyces sp. NPDC059168 TaxID=3346753 RepID=UPI0036BBFF21